MEMLGPSREFSRWIGCPKDCFCNSDHAGSSLENRTGRCERNAGSSAQDYVGTCLFPEAPHSFNADRLLVCMLRACFKDRTDGEIVRGRFENSGQKRVASAEGSENALGANKTPRLCRIQITGIDMGAIKLRLLSQISTVIENQLYLFARHRHAQYRGILEDLCCGPVLVSILEQRDTRIGKRLSKPAEKIGTADGRDNRGIENGIDPRERELHATRIMRRGGQTTKE